MRSRAERGSRHGGVANQGVSNPPRSTSSFSRSTFGVWFSHGQQPNWPLMRTIATRAIFLRGVSTTTTSLAAHSGQSKVTHEACTTPVKFSGPVAYLTRPANTAEDYRGQQLVILDANEGPENRRSR